MKKALLLIVLSIINSGLFAQVPKGRYFDDINGTVWKASVQIDKDHLPELKEFALIIIEKEVSTLQENTIIWTFGETLRIESLDANTQERTLILECKYSHDTANKTFKILLRDQVFDFSYLPESSGRYISFHKEKK